ncbi:MAG TPA: serine/threonine-protein kinase [Pseudomonadota bacterium]|nr:serine/threonine-protein kinase [Pseudomonadota bacterium]
MASPAEPRNANASSLIGKTIGGRYTIRAAIGSGGMGHVYRATQAPMNREVAIKVLRVDLAGQEGVKERFKREARAASLIQHPNAITIFDFDEDGELLYLTMEFLSGETLRQRLRREPILTVDQALDMFESMAGALGAAHRVGVVHRDLKPDNIFLAKFDAVGEVVKVLDFGLAKLLDRAATGEEQLTDHNLRLGTPRYMAPEQALGIQPIDSRCDVYALGLLLFEMLAQRAPFVGDDGMEVLAQRLRREAPRLSQVAPQKNFGPQMDELLANMLKRDREQRPQDANVILGQVRDIRKNNQVYRPLDELGDGLVAQEQPGRHSGGNPAVGRPSMPGAMGRTTGNVGRGGAPASNNSWQSGQRGDGRGARPESMISLDQDDDLDKRTVVVDPGMQIADLPKPTQLPQAMLDMPTAIGQLGHQGLPLPPGMGGHPGVSIPPVARQAYPRPTPMPLLGETADATAQSASASTQLPQQGKNRKLQMFIVLAVLAVLAPLVALLLKGLLSHGEDHGDSQVVPEIERLHKVAPPPARAAAAPSPPAAATPVTPVAGEAEAPAKAAAGEPDTKLAVAAPDDGADATDEDEPADKPAADKPAKSARASRSAARAKKTGSTVRILVDSTPRKATVERDGKKIGITPVVDSPSQGSRAVRYRIVAKGYKPYEESVLPDRKRTLSAKLKPEPKS